MNVHRAVKCMVDCTSGDVRSRHVTIDVKVDGVSAESKCLASVCDLNDEYTWHYKWSLVEKDNPTLLAAFLIINN